MRWGVEGNQGVGERWQHLKMIKPLVGVWGMGYGVLGVFRVYRGTSLIRNRHPP